MFAKLKRKLRGWVGPPALAAARLRGVEPFRAVLEHERARIDRRGGEFCVIRFRFAGEAQPREHQIQLVNMLHDRLRATDDIGLLEDGLVGALLTDTPLPGAFKVADDVRI
ncbi:MAG TPA: hypothetical protein VFE24_07740, partial [Pirellulales bacterium]|nr:hypothetical protein [Pirellulales bacterium]